MKTGVAMTDIDWFGAEGGRLWAAAGAGATACFTFIMGFVYIAFRFVTRSHEARLAAAEAAHEQCREDNEKLSDRVKLLESLLLMHGPGQLKAELQAAISELHMDVRRIEKEGGR